MSHLEKIQDKVLPSVANRPLDSEPMSRQEMLTDYGTVQHDPTLLNERLKEFQGQHGQVKGLDIWMSWVEDMEKGDA
jgi:hypothetical protein